MPNVALLQKRERDLNANLISIITYELITVWWRNLTDINNMCEGHEGLTRNWGFSCSFFFINLSNYFDSCLNIVILQNNQKYLVWIDKLDSDIFWN